MLEFLRKYQYGLMFVVAVVVIIAFAFLYDRNSYSAERVENAFEVYGKDFTDADVKRGQQTFQLAQQLGLYEFLGSLYGQRQDGSPQEFIYQHIILKKKALEMGLHASQEAIEKKIITLQPFQFQGSFDQTAFDNVKQNLGSFGYTVQDLYDLVGDAVVLEKLKELLAANYIPAASEVEDNFLSRYEKVSAYKIELKKEDYAKDLAVTDEEIAKYYDENKLVLMSDAQRAVEYVHFVSPVFEEPAPPQPVFPDGLAPPEMLRALEDATDTLEIPDLGNLDSSTNTLPDAENSLNGETTPMPVEEATPTPDAPAPAEPASTEEGTDAVPEDSSAIDDLNECQGTNEVIDDEEPAVTEPAATEPAATEPAATEPAATEPAATEPAATEPAATEPAATEPAATEPAATELTVAPAVATAEEKKAASDMFLAAIDGFIGAAKTGDFAELTAAATLAAEGQKYQIKSGKVELFSRDKAPDLFKDEAALVDAIFSRPTAQPLSNPPVRVQDGFYVFKLTDSKEPVQLTLEEATEKIREILLAQKTTEALENAGKEVAEKLSAELKKGTKFSDAAKTLNLNPEKIPSFEGMAVPGDNADLREILSNTVAGQVSKAVIGEDKASLVYVASRVLSEEVQKTAEEKKKSIASQLSDFSYERVIFDAWLTEARKEANPKPDNLGLGRPVF